MAKGKGTGIKVVRRLGRGDIVALAVVNFALGWLLRSQSPAFYALWLDLAMGIAALAAGLAVLISIVRSTPVEAVEDPDTGALVHLALPSPGANG
jgi:hypothetical protein